MVAEAVARNVLSQVLSGDSKAVGVLSQVYTFLDSQFAVVKLLKR